MRVKPLMFNVFLKASLPNTTSLATNLNMNFGGDKHPNSRILHEFGTQRCNMPMDTYF
jgi:hypothetical protein